MVFWPIQTIPFQKSGLRVSDPVPDCPLEPTDSPVELPPSVSEKNFGEDQPKISARDRYRLPRRMVLIYNGFLLYYLLQNPQLAEVYHRPVPFWLNFPVMLFAAMAAGVGCRWVSPATGLLLAGLAGYLVSYLGLDGPYSITLALVTGMLTITLLLEFRIGNAED